MTKVWGFGAPVGPLQFSTAGWRENARDKLKPRDLVVLVGTKSDPTPPEMQGRLLGVMRPTIEPVMSFDFELPSSPQDFVDGEYKWPFGLMNVQAWSVPDRPIFTEVTNRFFSMDSAQGIVELNAGEEAIVRAYRWVKEPLLPISATAQTRLARHSGVPKPTAPPPQTTRRGVMHMRRAPAYTYAMQIEGSRLVAFKVGWAFDYHQRTYQFNKASMPELGGLRYHPILFHLWNTARQAFAMEQQLLRYFSKFRHSSNAEIVHGVKEENFRFAWINTLQQFSRGGLGGKR